MGSLCKLPLPNNKVESGISQWSCDGHLRFPKSLDSKKINIDMVNSALVVIVIVENEEE